MPEPAGLSVGLPMNGQLVIGMAMLLVASTEKLKPVALVKENINWLPLNVAPTNFDCIGAGMLNDELVTPVNPLELNVMVA